ncbi:hypothetical protein P2G88_00605 [Aliiglaciecola sp. CAU 1673]|uniref:hypothetical protein n=1 Tax=Aliiglaciecola sp. CAU 1673 TaxID=3032595 RepID=UPI0023DC6303|nr:hypothetical protein [Aliiglaciecola sp. CAU 1673]MDF2176748.1 hypothetical protein [Aliiglaciecola sp. CAU 1673]
MTKFKVLCTLALLASMPLNAALINLTGIGYATYGDFNSYSLPIGNLQLGCTTGNCPLTVKSGPGQIQDLVVVATGASGQGVNTNFAGMDNAYATPNGQGDPNFFSTGGEPDPGEVSAFSGDSSDTWDASLLSLKDFLAGEAMVFLFNNNNLNGQNEQSLAAWAQITVTNNVGGTLGIFDFTNNGGAYALISEGGGGNFLGDPGLYTSSGSGPTLGDNTSTDYVLSGGPICIDNDALPGTPVPVSCTSLDADEGPINHNLGADTAAYAIIGPELNSLLDGLFTSVSDTDLADYTMHIDLRLGCDPGFGAEGDEICSGLVSGFGKNLNNGYEQLFIATASLDTPRVPEPQALLLFALGILILVVSSRNISRVAH